MLPVQLWGVCTVEKLRSKETGWFPARDSYEEAVLSWYEQIELSFRRRELEAQRRGQDSWPGEAAEAQSPGGEAD